MLTNVSYRPVNQADRVVDETKGKNRRGLTRQKTHTQPTGAEVARSIERFNCRRRLSFEADLRHRIFWSIHLSLDPISEYRT